MILAAELSQVLVLGGGLAAQSLLLISTSFLSSIFLLFLLHVVRKGEDQQQVVFLAFRTNTLCTTGHTVNNWLSLGSQYIAVESFLFLKLSVPRGCALS